jgi:mRNA-degrading endonuclease YafQ of YafQ-DinJ toxin-antitoxin module
VNIPTLIDDQRSVLRDVLRRVLDHLTQEDMEHRERFKDHRLQDAFPQTFRYHISKVGEAIYGTRPPEVCLIDLEIVEDAFNRFKKLLEVRGEAGAYQGVEQTIELLEYPLSRLRAFMVGSSDSPIGKKDAYIYFAFMSDRFDELREMAKEIDQSYASPNGGAT